jgi:ribosomal protein L7/L12
MSRPVVDYSKGLRRKLAGGKTLDQAFSELRAEGASIFDCIATVRTFHRCSLEEAKQRVESSPTWADVRERTEKSYRALSNDDGHGS